MKTIIFTILGMLGAAAGGAYIGYRYGLKRGQEDLDEQMNELNDYWRKRMDRLEEVEEEPKPEEKEDEANKAFEKPHISYTDYINKEKNKATEKYYQSKYQADKTEYFEEPIPKATADRIEELEKIDEQLYSETELSYTKYTYFYSSANLSLVDEMKDSVPLEFLRKRIDGQNMMVYVQKFFDDTGYDPDDVLYLRDDHMEADYEIVLDPFIPEEEGGDNM